MERQNVTLSLSKALLRKAKVVAALEEKSLSALIGEALEKKVTQSAGYERARRRHTALLRRGLQLGSRGQWRVDREELHARK